MTDAPIQNGSAVAISSESTSPIATTSISSQATSTCSGVTSGQTGIACVSCNQTDLNSGGYLASAGSSATQFTELCNIDMPNGSPVYDTSTGKASMTQNVTDLQAVISYSFTDCMGQCKSSHLNARTSSLLIYRLH